MSRWIPDTNYPDGTVWNFTTKSAYISMWVSKNPSGSYTAYTNDHPPGRKWSLRSFTNFRTMSQAARFVEKEYFQGETK